VLSIFKTCFEGGSSMGRRRRGIMSDQLKEEIAKELGFYETVQQEGWGGIRARDAGNMVKRAIEMAQNQLSQNNTTK
jgi:small acid-soluble spore protein F (minor alpha/beta-type SASP)